MHSVCVKTSSVNRSLNSGGFDVSPGHNNPHTHKLSSFYRLSVIVDIHGSEHAYEE